MKELLRQVAEFKKNSIDLISEQELSVKLKESLENNKPLRLKIGFDPTACDIHLGHTVLLKKLRILQDLGHQVYFIVGDFTAKIGDPSGKTAMRPVLSDKQIQINASTYTKQAFKILSKRKTTVIYNSIWYKKMDLPGFLSILSSYTVARILERDDFSQRMKNNRPLTLLEVIYPLIQGYDSYKLSADVEFGGTDQKFNLIVGRHIQQAFGQKPQVVITMPILEGLDGKNKMSKSLDNYIGITESPKQMFGKLMSIPDEIMWNYFQLLTNCDISSLKEKHPKVAKSILAEEITAGYHSLKLAEKEKSEFERVFSKKQIPEEIPVAKVKSSKVDLIAVLYQAKIFTSKNEIRRLLLQGGITKAQANNSSVFNVIKDSALVIPPEGLILKIGKKRFLKIIR